MVWKVLSSVQVLHVHYDLMAQGHPQGVQQPGCCLIFRGIFFSIFLENHFNNTKILKGKTEPPYGFHMTHCQKVRRQPCDHFKEEKQQILS